MWTRLHFSVSTGDTLARSACHRCTTRMAADTTWPSPSAPVLTNARTMCLVRGTSRVSMKVHGRHAVPADVVRLCLGHLKNMSFVSMHCLAALCLAAWSGNSRLRATCACMHRHTRQLSPLYSQRARNIGGPVMVGQQRIVVLPSLDFPGCIVSVLQQGIEYPARSCETHYRPRLGRT